VEGGDSRFVAQGNRSFTSHRDYHMFAWDFVNANREPKCCSADGKVVVVVDNFDGIGLLRQLRDPSDRSTRMGQRSAYAHHSKQGSARQIGRPVKQGQPIANSGMVGQAPGPHLHFYVINKEGTSSTADFV